jgi:sulfate adenylyltransferase subunit 2
MNLKEKEKNSIYIIREIYAQEKNLALLWSMGKDSTVLLWLTRKAFFGEIPFPVVHIDTTYKFPEMYEFRDYYAKEWGIDLIIKKNESALKEGISYDNTKATDVCHKLKTEPLKDFVREHKLKGLFVGIRSDEHNIRAKEQIVSIRDKDFNWDYKNNIRQVGDIYKYSLQKDEHLRIHPIIEWTEKDIWQYIKSENIPVCELYFAKNGKRYRSLGCQPITKPVNSGATTVSEIINELDFVEETERSGRLQDKEDKLAMQKLRSLGYM